MEDKIVLSINGLEIYESSCRLIDDNYYIIGDVNIEHSGDVFLINKRYIRIENLVYNNTIKKYTLPSKDLLEGVVSFDSSNKPKFGYFEKNMLYNVILFNENSEMILCLNKNIVPLCYREELSTGYYFHISLKKAKDLNNIIEVSRELKESLPYDSRGITDKFKSKFEKNYNPIITKSVKTYSPLLKNYTFGLEFETTKGVLSKEKMDILPLIPLRDGSISGLEYVTVPLSGELGLQALIDSVEELKSKTVFDNSCALHYHIGGIPRTPEFILAFYKISSFFQDEMFSMFPLYKKYNFGVKRKNYSKPFPVNKINSLLDSSIDIENKSKVHYNFNVLFKYLSEGYGFEQYGNDLSNVLEHPRDPNGNQKWNISTRYYANNLIPLIFGNKQTIEFRIHTPTYDINKIVNFLLFNIYIIDFTVMNTKQILENPSFFVNIDNFRDFIKIYLRNSKIDSSSKKILIDYHISYINTRIKRTEQANSAGLIEGDENKIECPSYVKWKSVDDLTLSREEAYYSYDIMPISINRVISKKKINENKKRNVFEKKEYDTKTPLNSKLDNDIDNLIFSYKESFFNESLNIGNLIKKNITKDIG